MRCWQCKYNYVDTYLHKYILTFAQSHKNKLKCLFTEKKKKKKKSEWLLQQNHNVGGMIEAFTERMDIFHQNFV